MSPLTLERMEGKASPAGLCPAAGNSGGRQRPLMHFRWVGGWSVCAYVRGRVCVCVREIGMCLPYQKPFPVFKRDFSIYLQSQLEA